MEHIGIGAPSHIADDPWHRAPILSERAGQVKRPLECARGGHKSGHNLNSREIPRWASV